MQPPAGSGCHRYYSIVYVQRTGVSPTLPDSNRLNWNFPQWATNFSMTRMAVNYFATQNVARTGPCPPF